MDYGFPTMESLDLDLLLEANMGFQDVYLGDDVLRDMIPAANGHFAKEQEWKLLVDKRKLWSVGQIMGSTVTKISKQ